MILQSILLKEIYNCLPTKKNINHNLSVLDYNRQNASSGIRYSFIKACITKIIRTFSFQNIHK
jgi:hypothetical protein